MQSTSRCVAIVPIRSATFGLVVGAEVDMERCNTCKWWDAGVCDVVNTLLVSDPDTRFEIDAEVDDDSGLSVKLRAGPYFGCVHHKPK
jgi:hypothetical protein